MSKRVLESLRRDLIPADAQLGSVHLLGGRVLQRADLIFLRICLRHHELFGILLRMYVDVFFI